MANGQDDEANAKRSRPDKGAFEAAEPRIVVEDRTYGSRFAHDEHRAGTPAVDAAQGEDARGARPPWELGRVGRVLAIGLASASLSHMVHRTTRRQRRVALGGALGVTAALFGLGAWLARRA